MLRSLLSPRWIAGHIAVLLVAGSFLFLGLWQMDRRNQRREEIAVIRSRISRKPAELRDLLPSTALAAQAAERLAYRRATVRGTFDTEHEVLLEGRSNLGRPGRHVLTPLKTSDSSAVVVDRGWIPMMLDEPPVRAASPPGGEVTVAGILLSPPPRARLGPADPAPGRVRRLPRVDLERLDAQVPYRVYPLFLQLEKQEPPNPGALPAPAPVAKPDEGPHLSYAIQWFSFAAFALITYAAFVRRQLAGQSSPPNEPSRRISG